MFSISISFQECYMNEMVHYVLLEVCFFFSPLAKSLGFYSGFLCQIILTFLSFWSWQNICIFENFNLESSLFLVWGMIVFSWNQDFFCYGLRLWILFKVGLFCFIRERRGMLPHYFQMEIEVQVWHLAFIDNQRAKFLVTIWICKFGLPMWSSLILW